MNSVYLICIVVPRILITLKFLSPTNAPLNYTQNAKIYCWIISFLLHVSVHLDHHQGAYAEPCKSYNFVEIVSKNTSLYVQQCCGKKCFKLWCVLYALPKYTARLSHYCSYMFQSTWTIIIASRTAHNTHHSLKHFLPQHCWIYNDVFLLTISAKL